MSAELLVAAAGVIAGMVNALAGGGSLITFPALVAVGVPPLAANVTSTVGLVFGALGGTLGNAHDLAGQRERIAPLVVPSLLGAAIGTATLLLTPDNLFAGIAPALVAFSCALLFLQPGLAKRLPSPGTGRPRILMIALLLAGAYAGYFGSAVGILVLVLLSLAIDETTQRLNAFKLLLTGLMNLLAAATYACLAPVAWRYAATLMAASLIGGVVGARCSRQVSGATLRVAVALSGLVVAAVLGAAAYG